MRKILFVGKKDDIFISKFLQRQKSYIYLSSSGVRLKNLDENAVFIYDTGNNVTDLKIRYDLILFKNGQFIPFQIQPLLKSNGKALIASDNEKAKAMLQQQQISSLTVGIRDGDISLCSVSDEGLTFFCRSGDLPETITGQERFIRGKIFPAGILPTITGEIVSLLCEK